MLHIKPSGVVIIKQMIQDLGQAAEELLLKNLTPEMRPVFQEIETRPWMTPAENEALLRAAAQTLFPGEPDGLQRLGREVAIVQLEGVFKSSLLVPTLALIFKHLFPNLQQDELAESANLAKLNTMVFVLQHVHQIWHGYYDQGEAWVEGITPRSGVLVVREMPEMPAAARLYTSGFIISVLELAGAKQARVRLDEADPKAWKWAMTWEL